MSVAVQCIGPDCPNFLTSPSGEGVDQNSSKKVVNAVNKLIAELWRRESITFGRPLDDMFSSLYETYQECSQADWDGYGATAVTLAAFEEAKKIINLLPSSIKMPEVSAEPTGEIGFEWHRGKQQVFVISVGGKHRITYAGVFGGNKIHGSEYFEDTLPLSIIGHIRRLYL